MEFELAPDIKKIIEETFAEKAKEVGLEYDELRAEPECGTFVIGTSKLLGGVMCRGGLNVGSFFPVTTPETAKRIALLAVERQHQWWSRIEREYKEDFALLAGAAPTLNPLHRITEPGYYTRGNYAAPAL